MDNYFSFDGKYFAVDFEKIMEFVSKPVDNEKEFGNSVSQTYGIPLPLSKEESGDDSNAFQLIKKEVTETNNNSVDMASYRYQIVTNFLTAVMTPIADGTGNVMLTNSSKDMHFGQRLAFNTLFDMEIIYEIDEE